MTEENEHSELSDDEKILFAEILKEEPNELSVDGEARRHFLKQLSLAGGGILAFQFVNSPAIFANPVADAALTANLENAVKLNLNVNGIKKSLEVDSRMTLLDTLRERLALTGSKKGCDHGQCGACTVLVDGKRVLSCLTLAASCTDKNVTTIEGLAKPESLHPMQASFLKHDGFQCGYCTPGQICSAVALLDEAKKGEASYVTQNLKAGKGPIRLSDEEIRERMSGNICRCGAYPNIVDAIKEVHTGEKIPQNWQFVNHKPQGTLPDTIKPNGE